MAMRALGTVLGLAVLASVGCASGTSRVFDRPFDRVSGGTTIALTLFDPGGQPRLDRQQVISTERERREVVSWSGSRGEGSLDVHVLSQAPRKTLVEISSGAGLGGHNQNAEQDLMDEIDRYSE